ncbi:acetyltransferase [Poritiphilus flavus]|uniref:Transferase n=1 Tax=Poritiphilus flavus TaxID=2697053 RepID=A0A6L9EJJ9_9FLAO|nr:acetyltransferase [Poritiphilus flavus]NAS14359.1 transferase [Poritiphilus flavus]
MNNIIIFGASGHGSVVLDCIEQEGKYQVIGFVDSFKKKGRLQNGYEILGNEHDLPVLMEKFNLHGGIIAIGDNWTRKIIADKISKIVPNFNFITAIHPTAIIGKDVTIGKGVVIMPGTIVNANCQIEDFCILNTNSSLDHDGKMEEYSSLAPRVCTGGNLQLGKFSAICLGANVIESITIKQHTVVGAGSLVIDDIDSHVLAYGSPAKAVRIRAVGEKYLTAGKVPYLLNVVDA